ncbi:MAG: ATP-binding cassette domain-containing protein [Opitutales bacterium]|nr:ATP-binding cassette domain-containing protein [Opitutales bacterium]
MAVSDQSDCILEVSSLTKTYATAHGPLTVLEEANFALARGSTAAIVGPSGSGKTTLLGLCAGLDTPSTGSVRLAGEALEALSEDARAAVRMASVGFVFQNFQLVPTLTALENVMIPMELRGQRRARAIAADRLAEVGLGERLDHYPIQLSGGEQQRVALARAFANEPEILFADEPTGNLDTATSELITRLIFDLNRSRGTTLVLVTHDPELAALTERVFRINRGRLAEDARAVMAAGSRD